MMKKTYISPALETTEFRVKAVICDGPSPTGEGGDVIVTPPVNPFPAPWRY